MKNISIVKLGAIGDVIQAAAAVNEYKQLHSDVKVNWIVGKPLEPFLSSMRVADRIIAINDQRILHGSLIEGVNSLLKSFYQIFIQIKNCDELYIAHSNWQYSVFAIPLLLRNPTLLFGGIKRFFPIVKEYRVSEYFHFLSEEAISVERSDSSLQSIGKNIISTDSGFQFIADPSKKCVALVPGGSKNMMRDDFLRRWPIDNYLELSRRLIADGYDVVLVGGKGDAWVKPYFSGIQARDFIGETSINDVVNIFSKVNLVVSHDTGPLHLATMTATPLVAIFGPTPASAVVPIGRKSLAVLRAGANVACAPCYDGVNYAPCKHPICMKSTTVDMVYEKAMALLSEDSFGA
ncbi:glycosyltransferase family 9 protein [Polynucleobacter sp. es-MAR-4]|uniref:glycosyltransferase family 9 protein n=1 Tax=Polynucleobacter sp. es-MAR-4 TaxID=1855655 RepID=UPI001C0E06B4|nr:glycosyltransferase family 9 protein [Polynucleobacter sp. es-MAR-4]MBU3637587.1 glycosyltransferase family 9 protein [Polynucleobacter sp. es-MAR-4]